MTRILLARWTGTWSSTIIFAKTRPLDSYGRSACGGFRLGCFPGECFIEILEYPTPTRNHRSIKERLGTQWGSHSIWRRANRILEMAEEARRAGVRQLWAGNYGALTPSLHGSFDQVFNGYSEDALAQTLGKTIESVQHPPLVAEFRLPGGWPMPVGILFTTRGCSFQCTFCRPRHLRTAQSHSARGGYRARGAILRAAWNTLRPDPG